MVLCHNPYFNRWFSAISKYAKIYAVFKKSHNPYFNRWFSAIISMYGRKIRKRSHNPYFNRWFSAINKGSICQIQKVEVTILILIDGFLQLDTADFIKGVNSSHNPYFNRWFSAM